MSRWVRRTGYALLGLLFAFNYAVADDESIDFVPTLDKDEWYSEGWDQLFYFEDGSFLAVQISIVNVGFGGRHAAVLGLIVSPDGRTSLLKQSRSHGEWEYSEDKLDLRVAKHRLAGEFADYQVRIRKKEGEIDLDFTSLLEPWPVGRTVRVGKDSRYVGFYAPLAEASGRYRITDQGSKLDESPWADLKGGRGFGIRYVNTTAIYDLIRSATHIAPLGDGGIQPAIYVTISPEGEANGHVALFEDGRLIHQAEGFNVPVQNHLELADGDKRDIPTRFQIEVVEDEYSLKGSIEIDRFLVRFDPVDHLKPLVRTLVKILNTPIQYRYLARYDLTYRSGNEEIVLQDTALVDHVVMRHARVDSNRRRNTR